MKRITFYLINMFVLALFSTSVCATSKDYYAKCIVKSTGQGLVYVSASNTSTPTYAETSEATGSASSTGNSASVTFHGYTKANTGFKFVGWYDNEDFTGTALSSLSISSTSTNQSAPTAKTFYAKFNRVNCCVYPTSRPSAGEFYLYNPANEVYLTATSAVTTNIKDATVFTLSASTAATISYDDNGTTKYVYESEGNQSWGTTNTNKWTIEANNGGYYIYHNDTRYNSRKRYISATVEGVSYPYQNFVNDNRTWVFVSKDRVDMQAAQGNGPSRYGDKAFETYRGDNDNFAPGKVLSHKMYGLQNGTYKLVFFASAQRARGESVLAGDGIAQSYVTTGAGTQTNDITVGELSAIDPEADDFMQTYEVEVTDGTLEFGVQNVGTGANWVVLEFGSIELIKVNRITRTDAYGTICLPSNFDAQGATLYSIDGQTDDVLSLTEVGTSGVAGVPYIYQATDDAQAFVFNGGSAETPAADGYLVGSFEADPIYVPADNYVLQTQNGTQAFYHVAEDNTIKCGTFKCYLKGSADNARYAFFFGQDETAISDLHTTTTGETVKYDLNGRRLTRLQKGINIVNGRKVLVK